MFFRPKKKNTLTYKIVCCCFWKVLCAAEIIFISVIMSAFSPRLSGTYSIYSSSMFAGRNQPIKKKKKGRLAYMYTGVTQWQNSSAIRVRGSVSVRARQTTEEKENTNG